MTLLQRLNSMRGQGIGRTVVRRDWAVYKQLGESYWKVTRVKGGLDGKHGKAWGVLTWRGVAESGEREIPAANKQGIWEELSEDSAVKAQDSVPVGFFKRGK